MDGFVDQFQNITKGDNANWFLILVHQKHAMDPKIS
jgi:hypothetical protein